MMSIHEIMKILKCSRATAQTVLKQANVKKTVVPFEHGRKHFYDLTPEQLPEIMAGYKKDDAQIVMQQDAALSALEMAFGIRQPAGGQNAFN